jgi:hypothetical protein
MYIQNANSKYINVWKKFTMNIIINVESRTDNPRETGNTGYTRHKTKHKQNTICVGHYHAQIM